ncbi:ABC transporter ATP-binding protein [Corynebacterium anserum]|uniref:ATP-binding cassette domain-containing protein n=1 Tax=Corynebacterium anserum TaxID=2684406 RepID=A0A7G7YM41_9CORY|nr:ABC transporter ATP-binding protein [Corynebacterium anserum]MBC2681259.1 ATP-binding cassette domain-containing protein [Corynebacterium anserum]QNH95561.1 ATP-binding cassette domain-containing protein [Corynebacterium anserum]
MTKYYEFSYRYPRSQEGVNVRIAGNFGQPTVLLGVNGSGKTTLMKVLAGQLKTADGAIPELGNVVYVPQKFESIRGFKVRDYVSYVAWLNGAGWKQSNKDASRWIEFVGLTEHETKDCEKLSGGQQARVQIATALNSQADYILLDEPSAALDPLAKRDLQNLYRSIAASGVGLWVSSHQPLEIEAPFEQVVVLNRGIVDFQGSVQEFLAINKNVPDHKNAVDYSEYVRALSAAFNGGLERNSDGSGHE